MTEALHQVNVKQSVEVETPYDFDSTLFDVPAVTSPLAYAIPAASLALAACGGDEGSSATTAKRRSTVRVDNTLAEAEAARFILKSSLSVSDAEISSIRSMGYEPWLNAQIDAPISQTGAAWLSSQGYDQITKSLFDKDYPADYMIWSQLLRGTDSVRKRVALALSEFFVVSTIGVFPKWRGQSMAFYWDQLNSNAFGNYRKLLEDMTLNPAMGVYLSTRGNRKEDTSRGSVPDENYAREVMQLFTIGLYQLNNDGSRKLDANNQPIETYTNADVSNLSRVFTGYDFDFTGTTVGATLENPQWPVRTPEYLTQPMTSDPKKMEWQRPDEHSMLAVTFLGLTIPANTPAPQQLNLALNHLFNHPNVGPFFAHQMIQRFVTSNPSPAYIGRVASVFDNNGSGVRGDLRAVFKAILLDSEAVNTAGLTSPTFGKVREPILRFVQWARTFGATSTSGNWRIGDLSDNTTGLGQSALRSPSVFNFYRPGYVPANTAISTNSLVAPEFQLANEISGPGYVNFMASTISSTSGVGGDVKAGYASEIALAENSTALLDRICLLLAANQISNTTKATIKTALDATTVTAASTIAEKQRRVYAAILLVMASPDYLIQK